VDVLTAVHTVLKIKEKIQAEGFEAGSK